MRLLSNEGGNAAMIGVVIAGLVSIIIGVLVWFKINGALFAASGSHSGHGTYYNNLNSSWLAVNTTANTVWTLFPIVCIVMVAGVILAIVMGFGRGGSP